MLQKDSRAVIARLDAGVMTLSGNERELYNLVRFVTAQGPAATAISSGSERLAYANVCFQHGQLV